MTTLISDNGAEIELGFMKSSLGEGRDALTADELLSAFFDSAAGERCNVFDMLDNDLIAANDDDDEVSDDDDDDDDILFSSSPQAYPASPASPPLFYQQAQAQVQDMKAPPIPDICVAPAEPMQRVAMSPVAPQSCNGSGRKRGRNDPVDGETIEATSLRVVSDDGSLQVTLPRNTLIKLSSAEFEKYVLALKAVRKLAKEERKEVTRQKRLIKAREYAKRRRTLKKQEEMSESRRIEQLSRANRELLSENAQLKEELRDLRVKVAHYERGLTPPASMSSSSSSFNWQATGACLFAVMFCFNLFFFSLPHAANQLPASMSSSVSPGSRILMADEASSSVDWCQDMPASPCGGECSIALYCLLFVWRFLVCKIPSLL
jgi:hypothetical protein